MKTTALILLLTVVGLAAQTSSNAPADSAAGDQALRDALRLAISGNTNPPAAKVTTPAPVTAPAVQKVAAVPPPADEKLTNVSPAAMALPAPALRPTSAATVAATSEPVVAAEPVVTPAPQPAAVPEAPAATPAAPPATLHRAAPRRNSAAPSPAAQKKTEAEEMIAAGQINFTAAELSQVLDLYSQLVNRTILRAPGLPAPTIALKTQTPLTRSEAVEALEAVLALNGVTLVNIGDKFVKAIPVAQADAAGAAFREGDDTNLPDLGQHVTQIVHLKYAKPSEIAALLQTFGNTKSVFAVDNSGILVIRDYAENVKRMLEMIKQVDEAPQTEIVSEVIPIKYALASDISAALSSVSGQSSSTSVGASSGTSSRLTSPNRTSGNSGLAGGQQNQAGYRPGQAATPAGTPSGTSSFSDRLRTIINRASSSSSGGDVQILGQTKIIADERTNSLLVFATRGDLAIIKDIVSKLDVVLAQVLIEAIIMEVSLNNSRDLGISYIQHQKALGNGNYLGAGALNNGTFLNGGNFGSAVSSAASNLVSSVPSGFSYWMSLGNELDVTATAIAGDGHVNVLSRPSIQTSHAVQATMFIGNTVPYITGTTYGDFSGSTSRSVYEEKSVGISLTVLPLINPDGLVVMDIEQDIEQLGAPTKIDNNEVPTTTKRTASAKVAVKDRDTIILGGFISNSQTTSRSGVPLLKDIPLLGLLFRSSSDASSRVELVVLLQPTVLPTPEAAARVAIEKKNELPAVRRAEAEQKREEKRLLRNTDRRVAREPAYDSTTPAK